MSDKIAKIAPFPDLRSAGEQLAAILIDTGFSGDYLVVAIATAGVPVAFEIAKRQAAPLDLILLRPLIAGVPGTELYAANVCGNLVLDDKLPSRANPPQKPLDYFMEDALNGLAQRSAICRGNKPAITVAGRKVLLVDCGIRTSLTMKAAIGALRTLSPESITAAVPVTSAEGRTLVAPLVEEFICMATPEPFGNAAMWYRDFSRPGDEAISQLLASANR